MSPLKCEICHEEIQDLGIPKSDEPEATLGMNLAKVATTVSIHASLHALRDNQFPNFKYIPEAPKS